MGGEGYLILFKPNVSTSLLIIVHTNRREFVLLVAALPAAALCSSETAMFFTLICLMESYPFLSVTV